MPTFDVYPQPQTAPLNIAAGASVVTAFTERRSADATPLMYIRVAMFGGAVDPTFKLQAGAGDPVVVPSVSGIWDQPGGPGNGNYVADSFLTPPFQGVYLIKVEFNTTPLPPVESWKLTITNNDAAAREFTFVVSSADGGVDGGAKQPWISADPAVNFSEVLITDTGILNFNIANKGTGDLTGITGVLSGTNAATFTFTPPAGAISPNSAGTGLGQVTLAASGSPTKLVASLALSSNDTTAAAHSVAIAITAQVEELELAFLLDASGSMALDPDGGTTNITTNINATRYGISKSALELALTALGKHGSGKGFFGVGMYPDITPFPALPSSPYGGPFPVPSPSAADFQISKPINPANVASAITALDQHFTRVNGASTPMGSGIQHAVGDALGTLPWGYFSNEKPSVDLNRRWLFLMTDGNHNDPGAGISPKPDDWYTGAGSFATKKIQVAAIGYGTETAVTEPVNKTLLTTIAQKGYLADNTNFHFTEATGETDEIDTFIKPLMYQGLRFETVADPGGTLTSTNPTVTRQVSVTRYDDQLSFVVSWKTFDAQRLRVQVRTPLGELLETAAAGFTVDTNPRFKMLTFENAFLANLRDPANPRYGFWTLIITLNPIVEIGARPVTPAAFIDTESYNYDVFVSSRLRLQPQLNQKSYAPGDKIQISAHLTLDGTGIPFGSVTLSRVIPGAAHLNFLARSPLSAQEYSAAAQAQSANPDIDSVGIKLLGLAAKGVTFGLSTSNDVINMVDADNKGVYVATTGNTSVPDTYKFLITAVGTLPDGTLFQRERKLDIQVAVQPDPKFTVFHVDYSVITQGNQKLTQAVMTVTPLDSFGNAYFIDPRVDSSLVFTTTAGTFSGPIVDNHDGTYSRTLVYAPTDNPVIGVIVGGTVVVPNTPVVSLQAGHFIDKVFQFKLGREAAPGANKHKDPQACVGDFTAKPAPPPFVSLGGGGSIVLGFKDKAMEGSAGSDDVTIFIAADQKPRPYLVEATEDDDHDDDWCEIGRSSGVTQSFGLQRNSKVIKARALRISDLSWDMRNLDGTASPSPGPSLLAVVALKLCDAQTDVLEDIGEFFKKIF
jgi:hypothetical protein